MLRMLCVRHAQSTWNALGRWQGQADPPLSEAGLREAQALAERLRSEARGARGLVTSDLARARETAAWLGAALGLEPEPWPALREVEIGSWSGRISEEIARDWPEDYARLRAGDPALRPGGGESLLDVRARALGAVRALERRFGGGEIVVVTHLGWLRALRPGLELPNAGSLWLESGALAASAPGRTAQETRL